MAGGEEEMAAASPAERKRWQRRLGKAGQLAGGVGVAGESGWSAGGEAKVDWQAARSAGREGSTRRRAGKVARLA